MTQFCLLLVLLLVAVCIVQCRGSANNVTSIHTVSFFLLFFAIVRCICVCYSQTSFTYLSCQEYYSHLCLGVGSSEKLVTWNANKWIVSLQYERVSHIQTSYSI